MHSDIFSRIKWNWMFFGFFFPSSRFCSTFVFWKPAKNPTLPLGFFSFFLSIRWDSIKTFFFIYPVDSPNAVTSFPHFPFNSHFPFLGVSSHFVGLALHLHLCHSTPFFPPSVQRWQFDWVFFTELLLVLQFHSLSYLTCCRAKPGTVHYLLQKKKKIYINK